MSGSDKGRFIEEHHRLLLRVECINQAQKFSGGTLESIMEAAERYAAFVFQTGDYAEKGKSHLSID